MLPMVTIIRVYAQYNESNLAFVLCSTTTLHKVSWFGCEGHCSSLARSGEEGLAKDLKCNHLVSLFLL